jgi:hypothetical protein
VTAANGHQLRILPLTIKVCHQESRLSVEVELELLALAVKPAVMPMSWDFTAYWSASFGGANRRLLEQGRNRR